MRERIHCLAHSVFACTSSSYIVEKKLYKFYVKRVAERSACCKQNCLQRQKFPLSRQRIKPIPHPTANIFCTMKEWGRFINITGVLIVEVSFTSLLKWYPCYSNLETEFFCWYGPTWRPRFYGNAMGIVPENSEKWSWPTWFHALFHKNIQCKLVTEAKRIRKTKGPWGPCFYSRWRRSFQSSSPSIKRNKIN